MSMVTRVAKWAGILAGVVATSIADLPAQEPASQDGVRTSGFVDVYYSTNFGKPADRSNAYRNFDVVDNSFAVSLAEIVFQQAASPVGFRLDAGFGRTNDMVNAGAANPLGFLQQAYVSVVIPAGAGLTIDAGKFVTHMGYEVIESRDNWNYSRSFLFSWAIPYHHVGVRATYPVASALTLMGHLSNGWNNAEENNGAKTVGASLGWTASEDLTLVAGWIGGKEYPDSTGAGMRNVADLTLIYRPTSSLSFAVNGDYGAEQWSGSSVSWKGVAVYGRYAFSPSAAFALRGEVYDDPDGATTGSAVRLSEVTATCEYLVPGGFLLRAEFRHDWASTAVFDQQEGSAPTDQQSTLSLSAVVSF